MNILLGNETMNKKAQNHTYRIGILSGLFTVMLLYLIDVIVGLSKESNLFETANIDPVSEKLTIVITILFLLAILRKYWKYEKVGSNNN